MPPFKILIQYCTPQHALSLFFGWLSECRYPLLKNWMIKHFIKKYHVDMTLSQIENPEEFPTFNAFFTRKLKPEFRPITQGLQDIACPVDGTISQIGAIKHDTLLQAKGYDYSLKALLGGSDKYAQLFIDGMFATLYLAPKDYHRVHMPFSGKLRETIFIPGNLFSVNQNTTCNVPNLFTRNERLVCIFDTKIGPMAVILIGAMIVGSIDTVWHAKTRSKEISTESYAGSIELSRGDELGCFSLGSTVIVLFGKNKMGWLEGLGENSQVKMGQKIGFA